MYEWPHFILVILVTKFLHLYGVSYGNLLSTRL